MHSEMGVADGADPRTDDQRWAAGVAKGIEHDGKGEKPAIVAAVIAGGLGAGAGDRVPAWFGRASVTTVTTTWRCREGDGTWTIVSPKVP